MNEISFNDLKRIIKENLNVDKDWEQFKSMFEKVNQDFFVKIKLIIPELSENELRLCAYLRINLANHEIARILNISPYTLKSNRYRIRKKLNLESRIQLEDYIRGI
jgi:DNA-binding CsgD family transcriptional regulator